MSKKDKREHVLRFVKSKKIKFIHLWFTDILGFLKSFAVTVDELEDALKSGKGFDGSSVAGFARIEESDMVAMPDCDTLKILPWGSKETGKSAIMYCDILNPDNTPYDGDPRWALKKNLKIAQDMGLTFYVGPEYEYFYFKSPVKKPEILDEGGYFDLIPLDIASDLRRKTVLTLDKMGIRVETSHHEVAPSQHEIDLRYSDALTMADNTMTFRLVVKEVALQNNVYATFMPKPLLAQNGSGMHVHMSLFKGKRNAFFDKKDNYHLSDVARYFVAGLLKHSREMTAVTSQWVNSYKRLVPGYEAPVYLSWARRNRSTLVRVPMHKVGHETATRVEYRSPDPACNPYLAFAVMLAAGMEGIKKKYKIPKPIEEDIFLMTPEQRQKRTIASLPDNLFEAIQCTEKSALVRKALGDHIFEKFIENKKIEWDRYRVYVTDYEIKKYLSAL
jgi:glutamine synthetase